MNVYNFNKEEWKCLDKIMLISEQLFFVKKIKENRDKCSILYICILCKYYIILYT